MTDNDHLSQRLDGLSSSREDDLAHGVLLKGLKERLDHFANHWNLCRDADDELELGSTRPIDYPATQNSEPIYPPMPSIAPVGSFTESLAESSHGSSFSTITETNVSPSLYNNAQVHESTSLVQDLIWDARRPLEPINLRLESDRLMALGPSLDTPTRKFPWELNFQWTYAGLFYDGVRIHTQDYSPTAIRTPQVSGHSDNNTEVSEQTLLGFEISNIRNGDKSIDLTRPDHHEFYLECVMEAICYAYKTRVEELFATLNKSHAPQQPAPRRARTAGQPEKISTTPSQNNVCIHQSQRVSKSHSKRYIVNNENGDDEEEEDADDGNGNGRQRKPCQRSTSLRFACVLLVWNPWIFHHCDKLRFKNISDMKTHLKDVHQPHTCNFCRKVFSLRQLKRHQSYGECYANGTVSATPVESRAYESLAKREDENVPLKVRWKQIYETLTLDKTSNPSPFFIPQHMRLAAQFLTRVEEKLCDTLSRMTTALYRNIPENLQTSIGMEVMSNVVWTLGRDLVRSLNADFAELVTNSLPNWANHIRGGSVADVASHDTLASGPPSIPTQFQGQRTPEDRNSTGPAFQESIDLEPSFQSFQSTTEVLPNYLESTLHQQPVYHEGHITESDGHTGELMNLYDNNYTNTEQATLYGNGSWVYTDDDNHESPYINPTLCTYAENENPYEPDDVSGRFD